MSERRVERFAVQKYHEKSGIWRTIRSDIIVAGYGENYAVELKRARALADQEVCGWSAAFPSGEYRVEPIYAA